MNDYIYSEYFLSSTFPEDTSYHEIEKIITEVDYNSYSFNQIELKDFCFSDSHIISEIVIYDVNTDEIIPFTISENCVYEGNIEKLNDYSISQDAIEITPETYILLNLNGEYNLNEIYIYLYTTSRKEYNDYFTFSFLIDNHAISVKDLIVETTSKCWVNKCRMMIMKDESWAAQTHFEDVSYRYRFKMFKYFDIEREYLEDYYDFVDDYIKDESQSKLFYRYKIIDSEKANNIKPDKEKKSSNNGYEKISKEVKSIQDIEAENKEIITNKIKVIESHVSNDKNIKNVKNFVIISIIIIFLLLICKFIINIRKKSRTN